MSTTPMPVTLQNITPASILVAEIETTVDNVSALALNKWRNSTVVNTIDTSLQTGAHTVFETVGSVFN